MENSKIKAFVELGILCRGEAVEVLGDGAADAGPHAYTGHNQLCRYENPIYQRPFDDLEKSVYRFFHPGMTLSEALDLTRVFVFLGAGDTEELKACLERPDTIVLIFEPDDRVLVEFLENTRLSHLNRNGVFILTGNPYSFNPALQEMLPRALFDQGTPAFFQTGRIRDDYSDWAGLVIEYIEILHYRHAIYHHGGQYLSRAKPQRNIKRDVIYDQLVHAYENIPDYLACPDILQLKNRFRDHSAIVIGAGPDLDSKLDYIRRNKSRAVIICVNNALKPLVEAGIKPHFTIINDISIIAGKVFKHIEKQPGTILVGHCLADLGGDRFQQKYLFGDYKKTVFGTRPDLDLHGSVISAAFSLARHMGCSRSVIVGGQLASDNPWGLGYAKGTVKDVPSEREKPLIHRHPQLCPAATPFGETLYTTTNFRDAALWLTEVIRLSDMECYNTSKASLLHGKGIIYDSEPELPKKPVARIVADLFKPEPSKPRFDLAMQYIRHEAANWTQLRQVAGEMLKDQTQAAIVKGSVILSELDKSNVTNLIERYEEFSNQHFHRMVFSKDIARHQEGFRYYFEHLERMSNDLLALLAKTEEECRRLAREAGVSV